MYQNLRAVRGICHRFADKLLFIPSRWPIRNEDSPVRAGDSLDIGAPTVHVFPAVHDRILGVMPFPGVRAAVPLRPPRRPSDWVCGEPLAFLINSTQSAIMSMRRHGGSIASNDSRPCRSGNS